MNLTGEAVRVGPAVLVGDLLHLPPDEAPLLRDATATPLKRIAGDGLVTYTVVIESALGRRGLMDLLFALAPYKAHGPDRFARVLDNWAIYDRAKTGGGASNGLFMQHVASLKGNWLAFAEHRELYAAVFADLSGDTAVIPTVRWERKPSGTRRWLLDPLPAEDAKALADLVPFLNGPQSRATCDALIGIVSIAYLIPRVAQRWPAWKPLVKDGKSNYIGPASVPMMALLHQRAILNAGFVQACEALTFERS